MKRAAISAPPQSTRKQDKQPRTGNKPRGQPEPKQEDGEVALTSPFTRTRFKPEDMGAQTNLYEFAWSPGWITACRIEESKILTYNLKTEQILWHPIRAVWAVMQPNGKDLVWANDNVLHVYDINTKTEIARHELPLEGELVWQWADPHVLALADPQPEAYLWDYLDKNSPTMPKTIIPLDSELALDYVNVTCNRERDIWLVGGQVNDVHRDDEWYLHAQVGGPVLRIVAEECAISTVQLQPGPIAVSLTVLVSARWVDNFIKLRIEYPRAADPHRPSQPILNTFDTGSVKTITEHVSGVVIDPILRVVCITLSTGHLYLVDLDTGTLVHTEVDDDEYNEGGWIVPTDGPRIGSFVYKGPNDGYLIISLDKTRLVNFLKIRHPNGPIRDLACRIDLRS